MEPLDDTLWFPEPRDHEIVALGGDLSVERLLLAYRSGIFPWSADPITWWSPDPRAIFELDHFHIPTRLAKTLRSGRFTFTRNHAFRKVITACAERPRGEDSWIGPEFIAAYTRLHEAGHAHSVECWAGGQLAGGIYGISLHGLFAGESMFHHVTDAGKAALCHLVEHLKKRGHQLFDLQMLTPATEQFGAIEVPRAEYLNRLEKAMKVECSFD
ncbi:MAG: leucyl/phenylalanyl-tRNA--protein transferase [Verrucomicrobiales bacterium]|nr:leucyl/phenylalanyl-tRNA--protein transferase [Verrucomicrobiales bacterium]|tara:strand:+ start:13842 stop:14483 length:642 start_codon:yes stop_codon:yes gene_type:complete